MSEELTKKAPKLTVLFVRCLDCDKFHDLTCDSAMGLDLRVRTEDFRRFTEFLIEHSGHRITTRTQAGAGDVL